MVQKQRKIQQVGQILVNPSRINFSKVGSNAGVLAVFNLETMGVPSAHAHMFGVGKSPSAK